MSMMWGWAERQRIFGDICHDRRRRPLKPILRRIAAPCGQSADAQGSPRIAPLPAPDFLSALGWRPPAEDRLQPPTPVRRGSTPACAPREHHLGVAAIIGKIRRRAGSRRVELALAALSARCNNTTGTMTRRRVARAPSRRAVLAEGDNAADDLMAGARRLQRQIMPSISEVSAPADAAGFRPPIRTSPSPGSGVWRSTSSRTPDCLHRAIGVFMDAFQLVRDLADNKFGRLDGPRQDNPLHVAPGFGPSEYYGHHPLPGREKPGSRIGCPPPCLSSSVAVDKIVRPVLNRDGVRVARHPGPNSRTNCWIDARTMGSRPIVARWRADRPETQARPCLPETAGRCIVNLDRQASGVLRRARKSGLSPERTFVQTRNFA